MENNPSTKKPAKKEKPVNVIPTETVTIPEEKVEVDSEGHSHKFDRPPLLYGPHRQGK